MKFFLALTLCIFGISSSVIANLREKPDKNLELKSVHVVVRHGARAPATAAYPNDPYASDTYEPWGYGELTNVGRQEVFEVGKFLRKRYNKFLGKNLKLPELYAECTDFSRTKMTLQLVLAGLFPSIGTDYCWNAYLNWQPIGYNYIPYDQDDLLLFTKSCPRFEQAFQEVVDVDFAENVKNNSNFYQQLSNFTGVNPFTPFQMISVYSTLKSQEKLGYKLPQWTKSIDSNTFNDEYAKSFLYYSYNDELKRLTGGVFLKRILGDWDNVVNGVENPKFFVYGAHDVSVVTILSTFKAWQKQVPAYAITAIFELTQHKITKEFGVEIFLRNSTTSQPYKMKIDGCENYCNLDEVKELLKANIPQNHDAECQSTGEARKLNIKLDSKNEFCIYS